MNLYLLRHGLAVERGRGYEDDQRPLTPAGRRNLRSAIKTMRALELSFDIVLSSPLPRARETAEIVCKGLRLRKKLKLSEHLAPGSSASVIPEILGLKPAPECVLLVGHEPDLSRLASFLLIGSHNLAMDLKKGGLCKLSIDHLKSGRCATLAWLLTPRQMQTMS
jgi:phosphohistidine phosphatase